MQLLLTPKRNIRFNCISIAYTRHKSASKLIEPTVKALQHFDDYYGSAFSKRWPSIRLALLCKPKKCALLNQFSIIEEYEAKLSSIGADNMQFMIENVDVDNTAVKSRSKHMNPKPFEMEKSDSSFGTPDNRFSLDWYMPVTQMKYQEEIISDSEFYSFYRSEAESIQIQKETQLDFPKYWKVMAFPSGDISNFPEPVKDKTNIYPYRIMDGSSLLPVIALNVQPKDRVADFFVGSGDTALSILLTMQMKSLFMSSESPKELKNVRTLINDYLPDFFLKYVDLQFEETNVHELKSTEIYDKIILNVPCTNDRHSVTSNEGNFFTGSLVKKRNDLPLVLRDTLIARLEMLKPGGSLLYCTSCLSPVLNDGVVNEALCTVTGKDAKYKVNDLKTVFEPYTTFFPMDFSHRYGVLVIPSLLNNYGPKYFSKITNTEFGESS